MKAYEIQKIDDNSNYSVLVFSTTYFSPLDYLNEVAESLGGGFEGKVLFDMLLSNGNASNRFIEAVFKAGQFDYLSFKVPTKIDVKTKEISALFYKDLQQFWDSNIVSNSFKFLLKKGTLV